MRCRRERGATISHCDRQSGNRARRPAEHRRPHQEPPSPTLSPEGALGLLQGLGLVGRGAPKVGGRLRAEVTGQGQGPPHHQSRTSMWVSAAMLAVLPSRWMPRGRRARTGPHGCGG